MILCLDIGNTHIFGGLFVKADIHLRFRYPSTAASTSDTFGIFLQAFLERHQIHYEQIKAIAISSVVPSLDYTITAACKKYFSIDPIELKPGIKTGIKLAIKNPLELGADRVANAVAATHQFPNKHIVIIDFGTATTICVVSKEKTYLGGAILAGLKLSLDGLSEKAAKLFNVEIIYPKTALGKTTSAQLQTGLIYGQLGAIKEIVHRMSHEAFNTEKPILIATGGYAHLFEQAHYFDVIMPELVLHGLKQIAENNQS